MEQEEIDYKVGKELISYRITPNPKPPLSPISGGKGQQIENPEKQPKVPEKVEQPREFKQLKKTYHAPKDPRQYVPRAKLPSNQINRPNRINSLNRK